MKILRKGRRPEEMHLVATCDKCNTVFRVDQIDVTRGEGEYAKTPDGHFEWGRGSVPCPCCGFRLEVSIADFTTTAENNWWQSNPPGIIGYMRLNPPTEDSGEDN